MNNMEQRSAMGEEEDMFYEANTQDQSDLGGDEMYISLVQSITVKKCRIDQKKEKIKQLILKLNKLNNDLNEANMESKALSREKEELTVQQNFKALSLKGVKESRASLKSVFGDLTNQVLSVEEETKQKKKEYTAAIQNSLAKWESYKEIYEEFPLAKKRREMVIKLKKIDIDIRRTKFDIEDLKYKEKLKADIAEKQNQIYAIKIAKAYLLRREKISERDALLNKISELKLKLKDIKAGKYTSDQHNALEPITNSIPRPELKKTIKPSFLQLKMPQVFVSSQSQLMNADEPKETRQSSWLTLFSSNVLNTSKKSQTKQFETPKHPNPTEKSVSHLNGNKTLPDLHHRQPNREIDKSAALTKSVGNETQDNRMLGKRKGISQTENLIEKQLLLKKVRFTDSQKIQTNLDMSNAIAKLIGNKDQVVSKKINEENNKMSSENEIKQNNKETIKVNTPSSLSIKNLMSLLSSSKKLSTPTNMTTLKSSSMSQNLKGSLITTPSESQQNVSKDQSGNMAFKSLGSSDSQNGQPLKQTKSVNQDTALLLEDERNKNQPDNTAYSMAPTPPDIIPVETSSQPEPGSHTSQHSEFISPSDLDEVAKLHYQRIVAESPEFVYQKGPELTKPQQAELQVSEVVHSKYFPSNLPSTASRSQDLKENSAQEEAYHMPYSPPEDSSSEISNAALSPPSGEIGYFGFGENTQSGKDLFNQPASSDGSKSPEEQFGFNFMSNTNKKSSLFSLF